MGRGYTIFDTAVGRCGIAWRDAGIVGVQLPETREIETRRRLFRLYPDARELAPPLHVEIAIDAIAALLRGEGADLSAVTLDMSGIQAFNARVYAFTRTFRAARPGPMARSPRASGLRARCARSRRRSPAIRS
jgi:methylated-DNA-[protein]-cysteine S-methyltransferase